MKGKTEIKNVEEKSLNIIFLDENGRKNGKTQRINPSREFDCQWKDLATQVSNGKPHKFEIC